MEGYELRAREREVRSKRKDYKGKKKKKKKGEEASESGSSDNRFMNEKATKFYIEGQSKGLISERGIDIAIRISPFVNETLVYYGWHLSQLISFLAQPEAAVVEIVHEFYADLRRLNIQQGSVVPVRGVDVDFSCERINELYGIKVQGFYWFNSMEMSEVCWDEILEKVAKPGTQWQVNVDGELTKFSKATLKRDFNILYHFLCAWLILGLHVDTMNKERALLLFDIVSHLPLDT